jgi:hypothetical protein
VFTGSSVRMVGPSDRGTFHGRISTAAAARPSRRPHAFKSSRVQSAPRALFAAVRLSRTIHNYDFDVATVRAGQDWTTGFDAAGQVRGAGVRGEATYRWRHPAPGAIPIATRDALRVVIGSDYALANGLYLVTAYFCNQRQPASHSIPTCCGSSRTRFSPCIATSSHLFGGWKPAWSATWRGLAHNLTANTDLNCGAQLFASSRAGE